MNPNPPTFDQAVANLRFNEHFQVVLGDLVERRESAIKDLGSYKDDSGLRKAAAEITVFTELLDAFGLPTGSPIPGQ